MSVGTPDARVPRRSLALLTGQSAPPPKSVRVSVTDRCDFACTY